MTINKSTQSWDTETGKSINMVVEGPIINTSSESHTDESSEESDNQSVTNIPQIKEIFSPKTHTSKTKNYYCKPSPMNIQFEEIPDIANAKYDGSSLVEWNIDGLTEYGILNI